MTHLAKFISILFLTLYALQGCYQPKEQPKDLISKDKMEVILTDVMLYKQSTLVRERKNGVLDFVAINQKILDNHNISWPEFKSSFEYYSTQGDDFAKILDNVSKRIKALEPADSLVELAQKKQTAKRKVEREKQRRKALKNKPATKKVKPQIMRLDTLVKPRPKPRIGKEQIQKIQAMDTLANPNKAK